MSNRNEEQKRSPLSSVKILVGVLVVLALFYVLLAVLHRRIRSHSRTNLTGLEKAMQIYGNDSDGKLPPAEDASELKWIGVNYRVPSTDADLRYWLENMVWYHRFSNDEIRAATGLTKKEIEAAKKKFDIRADNRPGRAEDAALLVLPYPGGRHPRIGFLEGAIEAAKRNFEIRPDNRPKRAKDTPILVLPYPGGRHPRIGFWEGAIDPQRETKFSVFTPWDANSYVVVDVPEAIWSNLGLTYLAHTHIDTIWTKQGIELEKLEWNRHPDGSLDIERKLPNGIAFSVKVKPTKDAVLMEMRLTNGTDKKLTDLRIQNCVMTKMAKGFEQQTNENKVLKDPYAACRSSGGKRWIITAWEGCHRTWANERPPCFHSDPKFPDLEPGQTARLRGWLSFFEGEDIEAEFERIETSGRRRE